MYIYGKLQDFLRVNFNMAIIGYKDDIHGDFYRDEFDLCIRDEVIEDNHYPWLNHDNVKLYWPEIADMLVDRYGFRYDDEGGIVGQIDGKPVKIDLYNGPEGFHVYAQFVLNIETK